MHLFNQFQSHLLHKKINVNSTSNLISENIYFPLELKVPIKCSHALGNVKT